MPIASPLAVGEAGGLYRAARELAAALGMAPPPARSERALNDLGGGRTARARPA